jgi:acyl transferase domain-containing protein
MSEEIAVQNNTQRTGNEIAVIGISGRFPGAGTLEEFWENLANGKESITFFSDEELEAADVESNFPKDSLYIKARAVLDFSDYFDASFFGYLPAEAAVMDPQVRVFHECAWEALEDAGYCPDTYPKFIGLYAGASSNFNWQALTLLKGGDANLEQFSASQLKNKDFLTTHISYKLNLKGPSFSLSTACSTSLVAVVLACQGLLIGECDMALAGGVTITFPQQRGYLYRQGLVASPDGHCRTFDARAQGTFFGSGAGVVVLKLLEEAVAEGDQVYAVIKGVSINNDGIRKAGFTAPSVDGQAEAIKTALEMAEVEQESIGYIETHGTGTELGDPIEIEALKMAFDTDKRNFCGIGSVKTNIGHLDSAAGVIGFIKAVLALKHGLIPPSLHFENPNPKIDLKNSPFYVVAALTGWKPTIPGCPLRAGVSSFGIGGTNAHVILEEFPEGTRGLAPLHDAHSSKEYQLILLSAKTETALDKMTENLAVHLKQNPNINLVDTAYTLQAGRKAFEWRRMWVCKDINDAVKTLTDKEPAAAASISKKDETRPIVFMFPGQGAQYVNMGLQLYQTEPLFREEMDRCFKLFNALADYDIKEILYPDDLVSKVSKVSEDSSPGNYRSDRSNESYNSYLSHIDQTQIAQPVLFIFEYALAKLLISWGIEPYALIGHSIGEYTAACLSGVFSLQDTLKLVALRGRLMQQMPTGSMLGVALPEEQLQPLINQEISIAAVNTPDSCVVSGPHQAIDTFEKLLKEKQIDSRRLHTSHAFHSGMMDPIVETFAAGMQNITANKPGIPFISNLTGQWLTAEQAADPHYWGQHLRKTVRFNIGLEELFKIEGAIFVEVGPGRSLSTFAEQHQNKVPGHLTVNLVKHPRENKNLSDLYYLLNQTGKLWLYGKEIDWSGFYAGEKRHRVSLPAYPFERQQYSLEGSVHKLAEGLYPGNLSLPLQKKSNIADWFYVPSWKRSGPINHTNRGLGPGTNLLVLTDDHCHLGKQLVKKIGQQGGGVHMVKPGSGFEAEGPGVYRINPGEPDHYDRLLGELQASGKMPQIIIHLWTVTGDNRDDLNPRRVKQGLDRGFYSLLYIARALGKLDYIDDIGIKIISDGLYEFSGDEYIAPEKSTILGLVKVIPQEYSNISCQGIDIVLPEAGSKNEHRLIHQLLTELELAIPSPHGDRNRNADTIAAYRGDFRWVQTFEPLAPPEPIPGERSMELSPMVKEQGVYLITGGLGRIGLLLAEFLAKTFKAKLVLMGRTPFPVKEEWEKWLKSHGQNGEISRKIVKIQELEQSGAEILVYSADAASYQKVREVIHRAEERLGPLNGIIHCAAL